ncbi:COMM domain-containing protein 2 [Thecamonas trahens ATCC 50062]|uniref:COMM domain-containing protein 2 n=1 Tax=Thecamonas trahens ATCC 50062 TaxID=461836 RepID=A0A0L0DNT0_THETB|nr:COMM domain-containing protein 2 [Thecamonas trahens ATCC 50062]KNC53977.1 COMM domain-containing protein 2 [Thecamonas trahens ATCC 50062]|eukprot:XP_013754179.1 COMM domain-containing protein 2 [Thecamonas trahens ATCC 50062]
MFPNDELKTDLAHLAGLPSAAVDQFCTLAVQFLKHGANTKVFAGAASKLGVAVDVVEASVEGLCFLFSEAAKLRLTEAEFRECLAPMAWPTGLQDAMLALYLAEVDNIRLVQAELSMTLPRLHHASWRLDVQLASRSVHSMVNPLYYLELQLKDAAHPSVVLQLDYANMKHLTSVLEAALAESKTPLMKKVVRNIH